jgi:hypothetical protein
VAWDSGGAGEVVGYRRMRNEYAPERPDILDGTRSPVDGALGGRETAATPAGSRA